MADFRLRTHVPFPDIRLLTPQHWPAVRAGRLAALDDAPDAFLASSPHELTWDDERWRGSFLAGPWAVAQAGDKIVGIARLRHVGSASYVESVWTHSSYRRCGVASQLIRLLLSTPRRCGGEVFVWVIQPNPAAIRLYQSLGFESTGERQPIYATGAIEERLRLRD
jgi:ribosomal protein S18 acetylase RimI-like enzyme